MKKPVVQIQQDNFDVGLEVKKLTNTSNNVGAIVTFTGLCRDEEGLLSALELEHYPGMAENEITRIAEQAIERFGLSAATVIHRYGKIETGENIVLVVTAARHRQVAFDGAQFIMDFLKNNAPFWKKEHRLDGTTGDWVDAKDIDDQSLNKWKPVGKN